MANNAALEQVCKAANSLFPELNVRPTEVSHPTEAFLTRVLVHCLRAFGLRVEPPYNIESEGNDTSKEKRMFLSKLCRQVQNILHISFPGKTYTYLDITQPTAKKTINTLDVLFNYWCFYRMHKKEIMQPIIERLHERQALTAVIATKRGELEQKQQQGVQDKIDIGECEENMRNLRVEHPKAQAELNDLTKVVRQLQSDLAVAEEQQSEIQSQVNQFRQLVVLDSDVAVIKMETKQLSAQKENFKLEIAKQEQIFQERRQEIEAILRLHNEIDKGSSILPPEVHSEYKELLKLKERTEKTHLSLLNQHQGLQDTKLKSQKFLEQMEAQCKARKAQCEEEAAKELQNLTMQQEILEKRTAEIEQLEQSKNTLQEKIDDEQQTMDNLKIFIKKLCGSAEYVS